MDYVLFIHGTFSFLWQVYFYYLIGEDLVSIDDGATLQRLSNNFVLNEEFLLFFSII